MREDIAFAEAVVSGDDHACETFVENYSNIVLAKVWSLMKTHCHYPARDRLCTLKILQRANTQQIYPLDQCDECMDSYLWFFDFLKKKIRKYKGTNNCTLKTYVLSVLNSHSTYIEWLRWKYGRAY